MVVITNVIPIVLILLIIGLQTSTFSLITQFHWVQLSSITFLCRDSSRRFSNSMYSLDVPELNHLIIVQFAWHSTVYYSMYPLSCTVYQPYSPHIISCSIGCAVGTRLRTVHLHFVMICMTVNVFLSTTHVHTFSFPFRQMTCRSTKCKNSVLKPFDFLKLFKYN